PRPSAALDSLRGPDVFGDPRGDGLAGPLPTSNNFMRGIRVAPEGPSVLAPGRRSLGVRYSADNNLLRESAGPNHVVLKNEVHTVVLDYRVGLKTRLPVEAGLSVSAASAGPGYMNGFIAMMENHVFAPLFGPSAVNGNRTGPNAMTGTVRDVQVGGRHERDDGTWGMQVGDVVGVVKASLPVGSCALCEAAVRGVVDYAAGGQGGSAVSSVGVGVSAARPLGPRWSVFADARLAAPLSARDRTGLPVAPAAGATVGVSYRATPKLTLTVQNDYDGSPYRKTGLPVYDNAYTSVTFGLAYRLTRTLVLKFGASEDYNTGKRPAGQDFMAPYGPSDFSATASLQKTF
ncbi:MAG: hypothetical protein KGM24_07400, partial [Elusimicrobia bacterium]|nr:hypothetical protein [Elusimicrobiota bacterium]